MLLRAFEGDRIAQIDPKKPHAFDYESGEHPGVCMHCRRFDNDPIHMTETAKEALIERLAPGYKECDWTQAERSPVAKIHDVRRGLLLYKDTPERGWIFSWCNRDFPDAHVIIPLCKKNSA